MGRGLSPGDVVVACHSHSDPRNATDYSADGVFHHAGTEKREPGLYPGRLSYGSFASFSDPDGNGFLLQEITERSPGR